MGRESDRIKRSAKQFVQWITGFLCILWVLFEAPVFLLESWSGSKKENKIIKVNSFCCNYRVQIIFLFSHIKFIYICKMVSLFVIQFWDCFGIFKTLPSFSLKLLFGLFSQLFGLMRGLDEISAASDAGLDFPSISWVS